jgi:hypothetical protein
MLVSADDYLEGRIRLQVYRRTDLTGPTLSGDGNRGVKAWSHVGDLEAIRSRPINTIEMAGKLSEPVVSRVAAVSKHYPASCPTLTSTEKPFQ